MNIRYPIYEGVYRILTENRQIRANNVTDTTFIGLGVITAPTNIATAQRAMMTEKTN